MKKMISCASAFALAFSLFGGPAAAFAESGNVQDAPHVSTAVPLSTEGVVGPIKQDAAQRTPTGSDDQKAPVFNDAADSSAEGAHPSEGEPGGSQEAQDADQGFSVLDAIAGLFAGSSDNGEASEAAEGAEDGADADILDIDASRGLSGASLTVTFETVLSNALSAHDEPIAVTVAGQTKELTAAADAPARFSAAFTGLNPGTYTATVTAPGYLALSQPVTLENGMKHGFHITDNVLTDESKLQPHVAFMPYGDFDGNGSLDAADSSAIARAYVFGTSDPKHDMTNSGGVTTLADVQAFASMKARAPHPATTPTKEPDSTQTDPEVPAGTSIMVDGAVVTDDAAEAALAGLLSGAGKTVTLIPSANTVPDASGAPISDSLPVQLTLDAGGTVLDKVIFTSPVSDGAGRSMPLGGALTVQVATGDDSARELRIPLPCSGSGETSNPDLLADVTASADRAAGTFTVDFGENVKVFALDFTFTESSSPADRIDLTSIEFTSQQDPGPGPDEPDPPVTPGPDTPFGFTAGTDDGLISVSWDATEHAVSYEVQLTDGSMDEAGALVTDAISTTATKLDIRQFKGMPLVNGTTYSVRLRAVGPDGSVGENGTDRSDWTEWAEATPENKTPPANPTGLKLEPGYCEVAAAWDAADRAESYTLHYAKGGTNAFTAINVGDATSYVVNGLDEDADYVFYVTASNKFGASDKDQPAPRFSTHTVYVTNKVPWFNLINRTVQGPELFPAYEPGKPTEAFNRVLADGSEEEGAKLVDGNYNTVFTLPAGIYPGWSHCVSATFNGARDIRELAISTNLGTGFADGILDVGVRVTAGGKQTTYTTGVGDNGLQLGKAPTRDGSTEVATNTMLVRLPQLAKGVSRVELFFTREANAPMTISELAFYEGTMLPDSINALFASGSHGTELAEGVDEERISSLEEQLNAEDPETLEGSKVPEGATAERYWDTADMQAQLDAARMLLAGQDARTITTHPEICGASAVVRGTNAWQPTGAVALSGTDLLVMVSPTAAADGAAEGEGAANGSATKLRLIAAQNHGTEDAFQQSLGALKVGVNAITMPTIAPGSTERGGALYVAYDEAGCPAYDVKVIGAQEVPLFDAFGITDLTELKTRAGAYAAELEEYTAHMRQWHSEGGHGSGYQENECITNATEVMTSRALISVPATVMLKNFTDARNDASSPRQPDAALQAGLSNLDRMIDLIYQQAGLFDVDDPANAAVLAKYVKDPAKKAQRALPTGHINFRYLWPKNASAPAGAHCIAGGINEMSGIGTAATVVASEDGSYKMLDPYSWGTSRMVAGAVAPAAADAVMPAALADYYAQLVTSKDRNTLGDGTPAQHFNYDDVAAYVGSGQKKSVDQLPNDLGIALLWQLHLAYDSAYSYVQFASAEEQMDGALFARMNAYASDPAGAPGSLPLVVDGVDADNALMRLACAASQRNNLAFFEAWGLTPNADTRTYAGQFTNEWRDIQHMSDDTRKRSRSVVSPDEEAVAATASVEASADGQMVVSGVGLRKGLELQASNIIGYEVLRQQGSDASTREAAGFIPAGASTFTDRLTTDNGQDVTYYVRAVDSALNHSAATLAGDAQASFPRNLDKAHWSVSTTMRGQGIESVIDGNVSTVFTGDRAAPVSAEVPLADASAASGEEAAAVAADGYASVTIAFNKPTDACGIRYFPGDDAKGTFKRLWVQVSDDGVNWTSVGYKEITDATFAASASTTVYFTAAMVMPSVAAGTSSGSQVSAQRTSFIRVSDLDRNTTAPLSIAELDVIGSLPDELAFTTDEGGALQGVGMVDADVRLNAASDGVHEGAHTLIPKGSLVVSGRFTGNPAKSTVVLRDAWGDVVSAGAHQVLCAERDLGNSLTYNASGRWILWFSPGSWEDAVGDWSFVSAELVRSQVAGDADVAALGAGSGAVMTASCPSVRVPLSAEGRMQTLVVDGGFGDVFAEWM